MNEKDITATVFRFDPTVDAEPCYKAYRVPIVSGTSAMNVLDYIYQNLDDTLSYYDHAGCALGICVRCMGRINGRPGLLCQTMIEDDVTLEPLSKDLVVKDLVTIRKGQRVT
ncbi:MAG: succinate dehydrogenase [Deltaproteobacteria bacterium]|nr:succinate dehydrogenase [Deltaproteobacteria bacterium]